MRLHQGVVVLVRSNAEHCASITPRFVLHSIHEVYVESSCRKDNHMVAPKHIFLSYRSLEVDFALRLAADLKNAGISLWMDRLDGIQSGDDWRRSIEQALTHETCAAVVAVLSPDYVHSEYCRNEMARANRLHIPIYPVLLRAVPDDAWPLEIERIQYVDFRQWLDAQTYHERLVSLLDILKAAHPEQQGTVPDAETRYLTSLIADLESKRGVLQYIELSAETDILPDVRPQPTLEDEWGFELLVDRAQTAETQEPLDTPFTGMAEVLAHHARFVLIGEPGAGKTTTLRRLARDAARARLERRIAPLPLLLYLPQWSDGTATPADFVRAQWPLDGDPARLLETGDVTLFLDGLNEMGAIGTQKAALLRQWLHSPGAPQRVVVTCREADYSDNLVLDDLPTVRVRPLTRSQIQHFAAKYLGQQTGDFLKKILADENIPAFRDRSLVHLAKNPYMLSALLYLYENSPTGGLPQNPGALFRRLARALWERERQRGTPGWIPFDEAEAAFAQLAHFMVYEEKPIDVPLDYALDKIGDSSLLHAGVSASFLLVRDDQIRFFHQLMQEYFAAVKVLERIEQHKGAGRYSELVSPLSKVFYRQWFYELLAAVGLAAQPDDFLTDIAAVDPWLVLEWNDTGMPLSDIVRSHITAQLFQLLTSDEGYQEWIERPWNRREEEDMALLRGVWRQRAVRYLARLDDPRVLPALLEALRYKDPTHTPDVQMAYFAKTFGPDIRVDIIRALGDKGDSQAGPDLIRCLSDDKHTYKGHIPVAGAAAEALERIGTPEAIAAVEQWRKQRDKQG
jgi:hypothetical protein